MTRDRSDKILLEDCKPRHAYKIASRNLMFGVFNSEDNGFIGIRSKFGNLYLFTEYHYDTGAPFGTVIPLEEIEEIPSDIIVAENLGLIDKVTGREVENRVDDAGKHPEYSGWYFLDTNKQSKDIVATYKFNKKLFEYLVELEGKLMGSLLGSEKD